MKPYPKINTMFKRDMANRGKLIEGDWADPALAFLADNRWEFTEQVDGTNIRVHWDGAEKRVLYGGRTDNAQIPAFLVERLDELFRIEERWLAVFPDTEAILFPDTGVTLYGEGYGPRIQKGGGNYTNTPDFVLFDVRIGDWWLQRSDVEDVAAKLGIDVVPVIGYGTLYNAIGIVRNGLTSDWGDFEAEGIVARPVVELRTRRGDRIITKIKAVDFR